MLDTFMVAIYLGFGFPSLVLGGIGDDCSNWMALFLVVFGVDVCGISRESHSHGESLVPAVFAEEVFLFSVVVFLLFLFLFSFSSLVVGARNLVFFVLGRLFRSPLLFLLGSGRR